jgi:hypothetical protein
VENSTGKVYVRGYDRNGHALVYITPARENTYDHDGNMKHLVYTLEKSIACMSTRPEKANKVVLLIDFEGFNLFNAPSLNTSLESLSILQNHYPERLHKAFIIRPPYMFNAFWGMIYPFVDPVTKQKVTFLTSDKSEILKFLEKDIDPSNLEARFGGSDARPFDSKLYLKAPFEKDFWSHIKKC